MEVLRAGGLVLYKRRPARVKHVQADTGRVELEIEGGELRKVRPKDVTPLHAGPVSLSDLDRAPPVQDLDGIRELLLEEPDGVDLITLAEWLFGDPTPAAAWAAWEIVAEGLHFDGEPGRIRARSATQVQEEHDRRQQIAAEAAAWDGFVERLKTNTCEPGDELWMRELEGLAEGRREDARALKALGRAESPENAHALLLDTGWWTAARVPYAARAGLPSGPQILPVLAASTADRTDLTHLRAWAIDDEGNQDPDDAISVDDSGRLWVHIADVAHLVAPGSAVDDEARARGATLYQPSGPLPMLPPDLVPQVGLGLSRDGVGPALSFCMEVDDDGSIRATQIMPSIVRVQRTTYEQAEALLDTDDDLRRLGVILARAQSLRLAAGAIELDWPEVRIRADLSGPEPIVTIRPMAPLRSRQLVAEAMILTGAGAAACASDQSIAFPYSVQDAAPVEDENAAPLPGLPGAYALRRRQQPARVSGSPAPHQGLGLAAYGRATSPMRRYVDLLVHQQLRAVATGAEPPYDETALMERAAEAELAARRVRGVERQANRHWTLYWLSQRTWEGDGVLVDVRGRRGLLVCPDIGLETWVPVANGPALGEACRVVVRSVDLPRLDLHVELSAAG